MSTAPVHAAQEAAEDSTLALITTAAPYPARQGRPGTGRALQRRSQVLHGLFRRHAVDHDTRISHIGYDRKHTTAKDSGDLVSRCR
jgi:hypothetical protein